MLTSITKRLVTGDFVIPNAAADTYTLELARNGFKTSIRFVF